MKKQMKKLILFSLFILCGYSRNVLASQSGHPDKLGNDRPAVWNSSRILNVASFVQIGTTPVKIIFHDLIVSSPASGIGRVTIYDSTTTTTNAFSNLNIGTHTVIDCTTLGRKGPYDVILSSGLVYEKIGLAEINILWEYVDFRIVPGGLP